MPADFTKCVAGGGTVKTIGIKDHPDQYMHICYLNGKSYNGEVKTKNKESEHRIGKLFSRIDIGKGFAEKQKKAFVSEIEVLTEGYWEHPEYGAIEITPEDIDKFVQNFNDKTRKIDIAVDQEHKPDLGAAGWFRELKKVVEDGITKLKAKVEWTAMGQDLLSKGIYKYFSPEFDFEYEDFETHEEFENVLLGGALTNRPYFKSLAPVQLSENVFISLQKGGELKMEEEKKPEEELEAKPAEEVPAEVKPVEEVPAEEAKVEEAEIEEEKVEEKVVEEVPAEEIEPEVEEEIEAGEDKPIIATEPKLDAKAFNDLKSQIGVLEAKVKFSETEKKVNGYTFSMSNPEGKLLPKSSEVVQKLLMSLSEKQSKLFHEFVESLPKVSNTLFSEIGSDEGKSIEASEELVVKADALAKEKGITFGQAVKKVSADNPQLVEKK